MRTAVFALDLARGMHQPVGQLAVGGEEDQARGIDVEPADRDPAPLLGSRQTAEDGRALLGIAPRHQLALGLVVDDDLGLGIALGLELDIAPVDADTVGAWWPDRRAWRAPR
jgi:hypothetical protein